MPRNIQHSWSISTWPTDVYPHDTERARYLVRAHRDELVAARAIARIGRELVILGEPYTKWLERQVSAVPGFECPANRSKGESDTAAT